MPDVTLVTSRAHLSLPEDDAFLLQSLDQRGVSVRVAVWNDAAVDWSLTSLTVLRAAWDSHFNPPAFDRWLATLSSRTRLLNGAPAIRWNFDKQYLIELRERGFSVVPTKLITESSPSAIHEAIRDLEGPTVVAKPRFGADAYGAACLPRDVESVMAHFGQFGGQGGLLVQPFVSSVERERERSLVFIGQRFSHALYRTAFGRGPTRQAPDNRHVPTSDELRYCEQLLGALPFQLSYARVDVIPINGQSTLMELELIDPSLFLAAEPSASQLFADRIAAELSSSVTEPPAK